MIVEKRYGFLRKTMDYSGKIQKNIKFFLNDEKNSKKLL